jgi:hypothetical protein
MFKFILPVTFFLVACKKNNPGPTTPPVVVAPTTDTIPADPATDASIGFFMDNWVPKTFTSPATFTNRPAVTATADAIVTINTGEVITKISPTYFGNNANIWIGQVGTDALFTSQLNTFAPRIIRAPGGSISDIYFFNANKDVPPADAADTLLDANGVKYKIGYWYGKNTESWTQSINNYYTLLQATNSKGLITVNYGYARYGRGVKPVEAAAHLAADWVRYDNGRTKYWEVGNENNGNWEAGYRIDVTKNLDGQPEYISGTLYGQHFKIFADSMKKAATEIGATIYIGAQLIHSNTATNSIDLNWNSGVYAQAGNKADYFVVHDYFSPYMQNTNAADILQTGKTVPAAVMNWVKSAATTAGVNAKPVAMTEWNLFAAGSKQNVSHIAGLHAVLAMGEFIKNKYGAALRWDLANAWDNGNDHGLFSIDEPSVAKWTPRPAFYHMYFFQQYTGDRLLSSSVLGASGITAIATSFTSGQKGVVIVNTNTTSKVVELNFKYFTPGTRFYYYVLSGAGDNGEFSRQVVINGNAASNGIAGGPSNYTTILMYTTSTTGSIRIAVPERSAIFTVIDKR